MKRDRNRQCFLTLDPRAFAGKYVVITAGELVGAGQDLRRLLRLARKKHPRSTPFVARMRDPRKFYVYRTR